MSDKPVSNQENQEEAALSENELEQVAGGKMSIIRKTGDEDDVYDLEIQRLKPKFV
ncbi:MAG TPA: hypothetical protein HPP94_16460 [Desulfuromonadales bacterium]|nr:hypothetical protein [Desulfuromonadales bacterium]